MEPEFILVINAGSSSLKFSFFKTVDVESWQLDVTGKIEGLGNLPRFSARNGDGSLVADQSLDATVIHNSGAALDVLAAWLQSRYAGAQIIGVGHRVVHGGNKYSGPVVLNREILNDLRQLTPLAPLHQPHNVKAIEAVFERLPGVPQVACFDTGFHHGHAMTAQLIPLPWDLCERNGLRRYGFHGLSHEYIASVLPKVAPEIAAGRVIVAHLGNGASMCAMKAGKSVDCSSSFTALDGLCMGTRPGSVDPGVILHLFQEGGHSAQEVESILYQQSGLLGISGISNDMRLLQASREPRAVLAVDYFVHQASKQMGAMAAVLGGLDGVVFTAGIGENSVEIRRRICEAAAWMGIELNPEANAHGGPCITTAASKVSVWVIPTNEELMIAQHTGQALGLLPTKV
jgi:acetate kinase